MTSELSCVTYWILIFMICDDLFFLSIYFFDLWPCISIVLFVYA